MTAPMLLDEKKATHLCDYLASQLTAEEIEECKAAAWQASIKASGVSVPPLMYSCKPSEMTAILSGAFALKLIEKRRK